MLNFFYNNNNKFKNNVNTISNINVNTNSINKLFNKDMNYYVCSSGGCGSTVLYNYLSNFGNVHHIHDRYPPDKLTYIGNQNKEENKLVYNEWFNNIEIPEDKLKNYKVIFIYRNPIEVIYCRCTNNKGMPNIPHLQHIKCNNNGNIWLLDVLREKKDLYGLENFFDNYTISKKRNYPIYCVKYELFWNNISYFNGIIGIPNIPSLYPILNEKQRRLSYINELNRIYLSLVKKMSFMPYIKIVVPIKEIDIEEKQTLLTIEESNIYYNNENDSPTNDLVN